MKCCLFKKMVGAILSCVIIMTSLLDTFGQGKTLNNEIKDENKYVLYTDVMLNGQEIDDEAECIFREMIYSSGLFIDNMQNTLFMLAENENVSAYYVDPNKQQYNHIVSYIEEDGELKDAYTVIRRSVATGRTEELKNTSIMGFVITVNFDYYYPGNNGYKDPYYKHGALSVKTASNPMIKSVGNFNCVYVSRGIETDSEGNWSGNHIEAVTRITRNSLNYGQTITSNSSNVGNPYIAKNGSSVDFGVAFTGVAYRFTFGGREYTDYKIICYDEAWYLPDFDDFNWGF